MIFIKFCHCKIGAVYYYVSSMKKKMDCKSKSKILELGRKGITIGT